jgi:hypothetical protein
MRRKRWSRQERFENPEAREPSLRQVRIAGPSDRPPQNVTRERELVDWRMLTLMVFTLLSCLEPGAPPDDVS